MKIAVNISKTSIINSSKNTTIISNKLYVLIVSIQPSNYIIRNHINKYSNKVNYRILRKTIIFYIKV